MRCHAEPLRDRLEALLLFVDARLFPPPPRLMHKRPMSRIHQTDDPVIHIAGQIGGEMLAPIALAELRQFRHRRQRRILRLHTPAARLRHVDPRVAVTLLARISHAVQVLRERIVLRQRRNLHALAAHRLKHPAVILARERFAVEPAARQRNSAMRAQVAHGKQPSILAPAQHHRDTHQHRCTHAVAPQQIAAHRRIPVVVEQRRRWSRFE